MGAWVDRSRRLALLLSFATLAGCATQAPAPPPPVAAAPPVSQSAPTLSQAQVLAVVMPDQTLDRGTKPIAVPVAAGLDLVCVIGRPPEARPLTDSDLPALGLDRAGVIALAKANAAAGLRPMDLAAARPPAQSAVGRIEGDLAEASRILLPDEWAPVAARLHGHLLVAAPSADLVLYADGSVPGAAETLQAIARSERATAAQPLSDAVLRWTATGWVSAIR